MRHAQPALRLDGQQRIDGDRTRPGGGRQPRHPQAVEGEARVVPGIQHEDGGLAALGLERRRGQFPQLRERLRGREAVCEERQRGEFVQQLAQAARRLPGRGIEGRFAGPAPGGEAPAEGLGPDRGAAPRRPRQARGRRRQRIREHRGRRASRGGSQRVGRRRIRTLRFAQRDIEARARLALRESAGDVNAAQQPRRDGPVRLPERTADGIERDLGHGLRSQRPPAGQVEDPVARGTRQFEIRLQGGRECALDRAALCGEIRNDQPVDSLRSLIEARAQPGEHRLALRFGIGCGMPPGGAAGLRQSESRDLPSAAHESVEERGLGRARPPESREQQGRTRLRQRLVRHQQPRQVGGVAGIALAQLALRRPCPGGEGLLVTRQRPARQLLDAAAMRQQAQPARARARTELAGIQQPGRILDGEPAPQPAQGDRLQRLRQFIALGAGVAPLLVEPGVQRQHLRGRPGTQALGQLRTIVQAAQDACLAQVRRQQQSARFEMGKAAVVRAQAPAPSMAPASLVGRLAQWMSPRFRPARPVAVRRAIRPRGGRRPCGPPRTARAAEPRSGSAPARTGSARRRRSLRRVPSFRPPWPSRGGAASARAPRDPRPAPRPAVRACKDAAVPRSARRSTPSPRCGRGT